MATPANSTSCSAGQYVAGAQVQLQASPSAGFSVGSWLGTDNNGSTAVSNLVTMPAGAHTATVNYIQSQQDIQLTNRVPYSMTLPGGAQQTVWQYFYFDVPVGVDGLSMLLDRLSEDADLYVRFGAKPDLSHYDCRPYLGLAQSEACTPLLQTGRWWIGVNNYATGVPIAFRVTAAVTIAVPLPTFGQAQQFFTLTPCRVFDTRLSADAPPLESGQRRFFQVAGKCGIPATARSVSVNLTTVNPGGTGSLSLWPADLSVPNTSSVSFKGGLTRANNAVVAPASDGQGDVAALATLTGGGAVDVIMDVTGYFAPVAGANGLCYVDTACSSGNQLSVRDSGSVQCVNISACTEIWKCSTGPALRSCGGGAQDCSFSPGCGAAVQDCYNGFCTSLSSCNDRIKYQGYSFSPGSNQCSCPAPAGGC
ncbi:MAG: pre-peptidase C-terminal domain-containing protein [Acidobacteriota bacterium]